MPDQEARDPVAQQVFEEVSGGARGEEKEMKKEQTATNPAMDEIYKQISYHTGKIQELLSNPGIIRNKQKIKAAIENARIFLEIQKEYGSFDAYIWHFTDWKVVIEDYTVRTVSPLSDMVSDDLKKRGMKFMGSTTVYAYLQAIGVINAHGKECDLHV